METNEVMTQVPLPPDYSARLDERAKANDRARGREIAAIVKAVLDGRYNIVTNETAGGGGVQ